MSSSNTLLKTKLIPPIQRGELLARPRLQHILSAVEQHTIATVIAPAGYGKTSLLLQCYRYYQNQADTKLAWLALDNTDNDMARFMDAMVHAFRNHLQSFGESVLKLIQSGAKPSSESLLTAFLNDVNLLEQRVYLFLDDFHLISDISLLESISKMILRSPRNLHWVLATRTLPMGLPLGRLRALGHLIEINDKDLRFTENECAEFLQKCMQLELPDTALHILEERTEGWIAGLQLASLSLHKVTDQEAWLNGLSGEYRDIADFLADEVLRHQDATVQQFLLQTSILSRFNRDLCAFVTEIEGCHLILEQLVQSGLFIFSLDEKGEWYRFHHLFSEFLERRLRENNTDLLQQLHRSASQWYQSHELYMDAIHHACEAGEHHQAASLLQEISEALFAKGQIDTLEKLAARIPSTILNNYPRILLDIAWQYILAWEFAEGARMLNSVHLYLQQIDSSAQEEITNNELEYLHSKLEHREMMLHFISDQLPETEKRCEAWLQQDYPPDPTMHIFSSVKVILAATRRNRFQIQDSQATAIAMQELLQGRQVDYGSVYHDCMFGVTLLLQGDLPLAEDYFKNAKSLAINLQGRTSTLAAMPGLLLAELYYLQNRLDEARMYINEHLENCLQLGVVDQLIAGYITKAKLHALDGNYNAALNTLMDAEKQVVRFGFKRLHHYIVAERIRLFVLAGNQKLTLEEGRKNGLIGPPMSLRPDKNSSIVTCELAIAWSRLAILKGDEYGAIRLMKQWWEFLQAQQVWRIAILVAVRLAVMMQHRGDNCRARRYLLDALSVNNAENYTRLFLDEGIVVREILDEIELDNVPELLAMVAELQKEFASEPKQPLTGSLARHAQDTDIDLKDRELEILELAADDRSNQEIAERLSISVNTVKWHWQQIFGKLDVKRRGLAVRKARDHGYIQ